MKASFISLIAIGLGAATTAFAGTHVGIGVSFGVPPPVIVRRAPPPRVVERVVAAPAPGYVWIPGHYSWTGNQYVWLAGAWALPPRPDARWVDGQWNPQTQQWIEAHWEVPAPATVVAVPTQPPPPVVQYSEIVVAEPPPAPVAEVRHSAPPGAGYIWINGYWGWENGRREWFRGHWERPPHGHRVWVEPRWEHRANGYVFIRGYWM